MVGGSLQIMVDAACSVSYWSPLGHGSGDIEEQCAAEAESQQNTPINSIWKTHGSPFSSRTPKNIYRLLARINVLFHESCLVDPLFGRKGVNTPTPEHRAHAQNLSFAAFTILFRSKSGRPINNDGPVHHVLYTCIDMHTCQN